MRLHKRCDLRLFQALKVGPVDLNFIIRWRSTSALSLLRRLIMSPRLIGFIALSRTVERGFHYDSIRGIWVRITCILYSPFSFPTNCIDALKIAL